MFDLLYNLCSDYGVEGVEDVTRDFDLGMIKVSSELLNHKQRLLLEQRLNYHEDLEGHLASHEDFHNEIRTLIQLN